VFVVASSRDDINPTEILFEFEGVRRDTPQSRKEGERIAPCVTNGPPFSRTGNERVEAEAMVIGALDTECGGTKMNHQTIASGHIFPVNKSAEATWWNGGQIASTITTRSADQDMPDKANFQAVLQPIPIHDQATRHAGKNGEKTMGKGNGLGIGQPGDPMNTLTKGDSHAVAIPIGFDSYNLCETGDVTQTLKSPSGGVTESIGAVHIGMAVRRLTPVECERLQGFPDGYTNIPWRIAAESPDGPRYKALGNSWAVPVVAWIGQRIQNQIK
jgi:DNA (cytosine-5)-methyltransferase 1